MRLFKNASFVLPLLIAVGVLSGSAIAQERYTLTIYVNEGDADNRLGHVWIGLSDGTREGTHGFNPSYKPTDMVQMLQALREGTFGKRIEDESHKLWHVKKPYSITKTDYHRAIDVIMKRQKNSDSWCPTNNCGDFAKEIADAAGVHIELPWYDFNRPSAFGKYLRAHGGIVNTREGQQETAKERLACQKSCLGLDSLSLGETNDCLEECNIASDMREGKTVSPKRLQLLARSKGLKKCSRALGTCQQSCFSLPSQSWAACLKKCGDASDACMAALPALPKD